MVGDWNAWPCAKWLSRVKLTDKSKRLAAGRNRVPTPTFLGLIAMPSWLFAAI
jgi:hypothetical protein